MRPFAVGFLAGMVTVCLFSALFVWVELRRSPSPANYVVSVDCETAEGAQAAVDALCRTTSKVVTVVRPKNRSVVDIRTGQERWN